MTANPNFLERQTLVTPNTSLLFSQFAHQICFNQEGYAIQSSRPLHSARFEPSMPFRHIDPVIEEIKLHRFRIAENAVDGY